MKRSMCVIGALLLSLSLGSVAKAARESGGRYSGAQPYWVKFDPTTCTKQSAGTDTVMTCQEAVNRLTFYADGCHKVSEGPMTFMACDLQNLKDETLLVFGSENCFKSSLGADTLVTCRDSINEFVFYADGCHLRRGMVCELAALK